MLKTNRFVDHMHSEHEVKHEPEVVLAVSVNVISENRIHPCTI